MSHQATAWAISVRGIKPAAKVVLFHLANRHNRDTGRCDPSQDRLAYDCEMSRSSLNNQLGILEMRGFISREKRKNEETGKQKSTFYILHFDVLEPQDEPPRVQNLDTEKSADPCPKNGDFRVQNLDTNLVREPGRKKEPPIVPQGGRFEDFWEFYPRKVAKLAAERSFKRALKLVDGVALVDAARAFAYSQRSTEPRFIPHASTWLNQGRWMDPEAKPQRSIHSKIEEALNNGSDIRDPDPDHHGEAEPAPRNLLQGPARDLGRREGSDPQDQGNRGADQQQDPGACDGGGPDRDCSGLFPEGA